MSFLTEGTKVRGTYEMERFLGVGSLAEGYCVNRRVFGRQTMNYEVD